MAKGNFGNRDLFAIRMLDCRGAGRECVLDEVRRSVTGVAKEMDAASGTRGLCSLYPANRFAA